MSSWQTKPPAAILDEFFDRLTSAIAKGVAEGLAGRPVSPVTRDAPSVTPAVPSAGSATTAGWVKIPSASFKSGRNNRTITRETKVKVRGLGRGGAIGDGWIVVDITQRADVINVDVQKGRGNQIRTVRLDAIVWKRQS